MASGSGSEGPERARPAGRELGWDRHAKGPEAWAQKQAKPKGREGDWMGRHERRGIGAVGQGGVGLLGRIQG